MEKRIIAIVISALLIVALLSACSSAQQAPEKPAQSSAPAASVSSAAPAASSAAASSAAAPASSAPAKKKTIGFVMIAGSIEHCRIFDQGVKDVAKEHGDDVVTLDGNLDITTTNKCVEDLIAKQVDAIIIEGLDQEAHQGVIKQAIAAGIVCVQSDNWCKDESLTVGQAASDNFDAGYQCGLDAVKKLAGKPGKAIVLDNPGSPAATDRVNGFLKAAKEAGIEVVGQQKGNGVDEGNKVAEDLLQAHPDANVIFGNHDPAAMGALAAVKSANMVGKILIYGVDGNTENLEQIKAGAIAGTAKQDPYTMGKTSCQFLYDYWKGGDYVKKVVIPITFINSDNVDQFLKK